MVRSLKSNRTIASGILALGIASAAPALAAPADPSGTYLTEDGRARVRIEKCGLRQANLCGYVVWMKQPMQDGQPKLDHRNPNPARATRPVLGHQFIMGLRANGDENYQGTIYNNEDGKSYNVTIWLPEPDQLKVKGCLIAFLCSTQDWTRTSDVLPGQLAGLTGAPDGPQYDPEWSPKTLAGSTAPAAQTTSSTRRDPKAKP